MTSAVFGDGLSCSKCLNLHTELASLRCGHKFCRECFMAVPDTHEGSGVYPCPGCRDEYPVPEKKIKLCDSAEQEKSEIFCTYCVDSPVGAAKTCLHCETSMCDKHLTAHNKSVDHVLVEPSSSFSAKKCSVHKKLLEYYCSEDAVCLCVSCFLVGKHKGHDVERLEEASEKKKEKLNSIFEKLTTKRNVIEKEIRDLQKCIRKTKRDAAEEKTWVTDLFKDIRREMEVQEQRALNEISRQQERVLISISEVIQRLETQKDALSKKIGHIEELCNTTDPITVLQEAEIEDQEVEKLDVCKLDHFLFSLTLHRSLSELITTIKNKNDFQVTELLLDEKTAHDRLYLLCFQKLITVSDTELKKPKLLKRFTEWTQVTSVQRFSRGTHYWEVRVNLGEDWDIGVCYPTIERDGYVGSNAKAWSLSMYDYELRAVHDVDSETLNQESSVDKVGIYLDYKAGSLSFYELSDPIRHLHTFNTTFTEPLHAAFYVSKGWLNFLC